MNRDAVTFLGVMMGLALTGAFSYAAFTVINAMARRINARSALPGLEPDEVEALRAQTVEVDDLRARLLEVEERLDFTERLLADAREGGRLPPVGHETPV
jgi:hypothetical protein